MFSQSHTPNYSVKLPNECELDLFQNTLNDNGINKHIRRINNLIELNYLKYNNSFEFTNSGIEYMKRKHQKFVKDIEGKKLNFNEMSSLISKMQLNNSTNQSFKERNTLIQIDDSDYVNYNNINLPKLKDANEPMD